MLWYCYDRGTGYRIDAIDPANGDYDEITETWDGFTFIPRSFFGLTNENDETLQFYREADGRMLVDIPDVQNKGSWQLHCSLEEARDYMVDFLKTQVLPARSLFKFESHY